MASLKQIQANRLNALNSTGPRTLEGRSVSRYNALKSGIDAAAEAALPSESADQLALLQTEYSERFQPATPEQRCLVDTLISSEWLLRRFRRIEGELLTRSAASLAEAFEQNDRALERLQRRINATQRAFVQALKLLNQLQDAEEPQRIPAVSTPQPQLDEPLPASIGFVPPTPVAAIPLAPEPGLLSPVRVTLVS